MNLQRGQSPPLLRLRPGDGVAGAPPPVGSSVSSGNEEQPFFRLEILRALQLHRMLALGIALTGLALAAAYVAMTWPAYVAESQVFIQPAPSSVMAQGSTSRWPYDVNTNESFIQQQVQDASNPEVLLSALHKLPPGAWQGGGESEQAAAERLGGSVKVARLGSSSQVTITARAGSGELAAQIANAMAASVVERAGREEKAVDTERPSILREERDADEQLHNLMLEDNVPGASHLSAAAVAPAHPAISGVLRIALPTALGGLLLGLLAALTAYNLDTKIYIAADIERVLGFAPVAVLPDFSEVSNGAAEEYMLRLSTVIEHARQQGSLRSCIFTGIEPGAGVTTVATRVREMLEVMGTATVLVDASGIPRPGPHAGAGAHDASNQLAAQRGSRSTALVRRMAEEMKRQDESLVLTDAAPLAVSAETGYLARFIDCAIVVVESGVTTRAQLREAANTLQRLDVAAMGFVLNRVALKKADSPFRQSVWAIEKHLRTQSRSFAKRTLRSRPFGVGEQPGAEYYAERPCADARVFRTAQESAASPEAPPLLTAAPERFAVPSEPAPAASRGQGTRRGEELARPAPIPASSEPWWLAGRSQQADAAHSTTPAQGANIREPEVAAASQFCASAPETRPPASPNQSRKRVPSRIDRFNLEDTSEEVREPGLEETPSEMASRLSGLRNLLFVRGLKNLCTGGEREAGAIPHLGKATSYPPFAHAYGPVPVILARSSAASDSPTQVTARPELLLPAPILEPAGKEYTWQKDSKTRRDRRDALDDDVDILPSRRGQYRING